jgi:hypothetical protein
MPAEPVQVDRKRAGTPGIGEEQVGIDAAGVRHEMPDVDLLGRPGSGERELRQVPDDRLIEIEGAPFDLLEHEDRRHDLGDGSEQEPGVLAHRRTGDDVRHPMGQDGLLAGLVDADQIPGNLGGVAEGGDPLANVCHLVHADYGRALTQGQGQARQFKPCLTWWSIRSRTMSGLCRATCGRLLRGVVGLLRAVAEDEYAPVFATLVVRDAGRGAFPTGEEDPFGRILLATARRRWVRRGGRLLTRWPGDAAAIARCWSTRPRRW